MLLAEPGRGYTEENWFGLLTPYCPSGRIHFWLLRPESVQRKGKLLIDYRRSACSINLGNLTTFLAVLPGKLELSRVV